MPLVRRLIEKLMLPSRWAHCLLNLIAVFIALEISEAILLRNAMNGVYPPEADSIGIPLVGMMFQNIGAILVLFFGMAILRQDDGPWLGCIVIAVGSFWSIPQVLRWMDPLHYEISLAQSSLVLLPLAFIALEVRRHRAQRSSDD